MTKVVYFGNERLVSGLDHTEAPVLRGLIERGYDVVAVVSHHSESKSRNQRELEVAEIAKAHDIPLFLPNKPSEIIDELRALEADVAVLAAYGRIIGQAIIDIFPLGIVNIHPSLLPKYRGPTPIESPILNGDSETGVSIMQLTAGMDEGPVYAQRSFPLEGSEQKFDLYQKASTVGAELFFEVFPKIIDGSLTPTPQDDSQATYCKLIQKSDGIIDWGKPADQIEREVRAYQGWPQSRATLGNIDVVVTNVTAVWHDHDLKPGELKIPAEKNAQVIIVGAADDSDVQIHTIKPQGKKEMPVQAFLAGYRSQLGA
jgi:methionyl-tRNA formyltransferase